MSLLALGLALFFQTPPPQAEPYEILELPPGAELLWRGPGYPDGLMAHDPVNGLIAMGQHSVSLRSDQDGREIFRFRDHEAYVTAIAIEPGELVVTGDRSGRVVVRELHFWTERKGKRTVPFCRFVAGAAATPPGSGPEMAS